MGQTTTLEERVRRLERDVDELKRVSVPAADRWIDRIAGTFKDVAEFDEVLRLGREIREEDKPVRCTSVKIRSTKS
jgi:hypothetical protein